MTVQPIPEGYHSLTPYLIAKGATEAIAFYQKAFDATEIMRMEGPGGTVAHAELQIGDSRMMLAEEHPDMNALAPQSPGSSGASLCLYVENVDQVVARAIDAGAKVQRPLQDQFYGDRSATLEDPFGHVWTVATHVEDVLPEEMDRRAQEMMNAPETE
ncbi:MAG: glyoxalase [Planctomycetaceae bacterium]|nr:glyoxalase [Planctomycetaceae bacterium]